MRLEIRDSTACGLIQHPDFPALRGLYIDECAVKGLPDPREKLEAYELMDSTGVLRAFGAYLDDDRLIGFITVLAPVLPHYGITVAVAESLFVSPAYRKSGAGLKLIRAAEAHARAIHSPGLLLSSPLNGRLQTLLPRIGYAETNRVFLKRFSHAA